jgi:hypothetical protein
VREEIVRGEDDGDAACGEGEIDGVTDLAPEIEAVAAELEEFFGPMKVEELAVPAFEAAPEREEAAMAVGEGYFDIAAGEGAGEEGLVGDALAVIGCEEDIHRRARRVFFKRAMPSP